MMADVDIDLPTTFNPSGIFDWTRASIVKDGELRPHPCGWYPQQIPVDPLTGLSAIPYKEAEAAGFYKVDFLHLSIYDHFSSREEIETLLQLEPDWGLLLVPSVQRQLFQLSKHGELLSTIRPTSTEELADVLALIRPGKTHLAKLYRAQREATRKLLYARDSDGYTFKKSHAVAYSLVIQLQLHLISVGVEF